MRKNTAKIRKVLPDPIYNSETITKLINNLMLDGKKSIAQNILYSSFDLIKEKTKEEPMDVFNKALDNIMPNIELKSRKVGGSNYQIPIEVTERRRKILALRWLVTFSKKRPEKLMLERLAAEIMAASKGEGGAVKKKDDIHRMAEANRAFAHFRW